MTTNSFRELIEGLDEQQLSYEKLITETSYEKARKRVNFFREGWPGILVLAGCLVFYVTQILLLCSLINDKALVKELVHFGIWVSVIIYLAFIVIRCCLACIRTK